MDHYYFLWFSYTKAPLKPEVQIVTVTQNYFQRKMNILELKIATSGEKDKSVIEIPGCNEKKMKKF
jgi:putative membrane protein